jgi:hypothetical protein
MTLIGVVHEDYECKMEFGPRCMVDTANASSYPMK